jgi:hypothetical protein
LFLLKITQNTHYPVQQNKEFLNVKTDATKKIINALNSYILNVQRINMVWWFLPDLQKDIEIRELQEQNQSALQQLAEFVAHHIEAGPVVTRYLEEKHLVLPMSRSPGGSLTCISSRDCLKHSSVIRSPSLSKHSLPRPGIRVFF